MNIVTIAQSLLTPAVVARIATALGINPTLAQMAVNAALPAILGAIVGRASHPAGLGVLGGLLGQQNTGMLRHLGELIGSPDQSTLVNTGTAAMQSLFGQAAASTLTSAVGKFACVPDAASVSLMSMVTPLALGTLAKQQQAASLDTSGLAALLASQKDNIVAAMPKGLAEALQGTGLFGGILDKPSAAPAVTNVEPTPLKPAVRPTPTLVHSAPAAPAATRPATRPAAPDGRPTRWLLPAAAAVVLALLGWQYVGMRGPETSAIMVANVDVGKKTSALYEGIKASIADIKSDTTATANLPKLRGYSAALLDVRDMAEKLPPDGRKQLAALVAPWLGNIEALMLSALKSPGAEAIVKPVLDQIVERMRTLAKG